jgi:1-acyl-sn-glycerol-3-phosphate acyltransferase
MESMGASSRDRLIAAILDFLVGQDLLSTEDIRMQLQREIDSAGIDAVLTLKTRLTADNGWAYYPRDPLAQRIHHVLAGRFLTEESDLRGVHHLSSLGGSPVVLCANHLSYSDANVIEVLLQRSGGADLANRLTAIAGPKVFTSRDRRFSSLCFGTVKVPQSTDVSSDDAVLNPREVARAARRSIEVARDRLTKGDALLLFPEGTRSRTRSMQRLLAAAARYLDVPGTVVLPVGLVGPEALFSITDSTLRPARVVAQLGPVIRAETLFAHARSDRRVTMDAIGLAIAQLVPAEYRGIYGRSGDYAEAETLLRASQGTA